jgi:hypothetical protein
MKKKEAQLNACPIGSYDIVLKSAGLNHEVLATSLFYLRTAERRKLQRRSIICLQPKRSHALFSINT